jgi:N-acetylmuramic acid 6-phosphate (MurNAc-6-P) etherase
MKRSAIWAAGVVLVLLVVGADVLASGAGYAEDKGDNGDENAMAKCSKATLDGTYLFAHDGVVTEGPDKGPFAIAGMEKYDGNGKVTGVVSANFNGNVDRHVSFDATYTVNANCTGTVTSGPTQAQDVFIAPDGSMFTFVQTDPSTVTSGFELQGTAKRVGD